MDCPKDKLGQVIGKGGSNIKKLENKTGCIVDIDKVQSQIHLQGNESSIKKAIADIENIILAVEVEMTMGEALFSFLFNKVRTLELDLYRKWLSSSDYWKCTNHFMLHFFSFSAIG